MRVYVGATTTVISSYKDGIQDNAMVWDLTMERGGFGKYLPVEGVTLNTLFEKDIRVLELIVPMVISERCSNADSLVLALLCDSGHRTGLFTD